MNTGALRHWLANADALPARLTRRALRAATRARARARSGSVTAEMDAIVEAARDTSVGSGLPISLESRRSRRSRPQNP